MFDRSRPYNDLPDLPPATELETVPVLKAAIGATRALAELKGVGGLIPSQGILINSVVLQEAQASSEIENIVTTQDDLYRALDAGPGQSTPEAKEVVRYREALWEGFQSLKQRPMGMVLFMTVASAIRQVQVEVRRVPGVRIASGAEVVYTPPEGAPLITAKLGNLEQFIHNTEDGLDPLVKMAVMHYQFEAIHPFTDGNGRTGRILNLLYLVANGLLDVPVLFLSGYIIRHKADYYDGLRRVTEAGDWQQWLLYMLKAVQVTAVDTRRRIEAIHELMCASGNLVREQAPTVYSKDLIELIFQCPYCKIRFVEEAGLAGRQTASTYLKALAKLGLLQPTKVGREMLYLNAPLLRLLRQPSEEQ